MEDLYLMFFISGCVWMEPRRPPNTDGEVPHAVGSATCSGGRVPLTGQPGRKTSCGFSLFIHLVLQTRPRPSEQLDSCRKTRTSAAACTWVPVGPVRGPSVRPAGQLSPAASVSPNPTALEAV